MKIAFVVNDIKTEAPEYTTTLLAATAARMGHEVWEIGVADFVYDPSGAVCAHARRAPKRKYDTPADYLAALYGKDGHAERIVADQLDILMLRNDPAEDSARRPWAQTTPLLFAQLCKRRGVVTLNDPHALANALNKTYLQHFPEQVRPQTLISRDVNEIRSFIKTLGGEAVLKPLQGSGGVNVFLVSRESVNVHQMIEAIGRDGYVICQEYLPGAVKGDVRLFLMNGRPIFYQGKYAAFRRVSRQGDMRSNVSAGGSVERAEVTDKMLRLVEMVRPKLIQDGMFLAGLDVVDDKLMEVNVFSPGGLNNCSHLYKADFAQAVIEALERKVTYKSYYANTIDNIEFATL